MTTKTEKYDEINPSHYVGLMGLQSIDVIEFYGLTYNLGMAIKYITRAGKKPNVSPVTDIEKALWSVNRVLDQKYVWRTTQCTQLPGGSFVSCDAPSAAEIIEEFEIGANLKSGLISLFGFIAQHGEVSDAVLIHLKRGIEKELDELKRYRETFGYDRRKDGAVAGGSSCASDAHQHPQGSAKERAAS